VPLAQISMHFFTTRALELEDIRDETAGGWLQLAAALGVEPRALVRLRQVHGICVRSVRTPAEQPVSYDDWATADIATTRDPSVAVSVRAADCVPVLMADPASGAVAAVHAGWRGTAGSAAIEAVRALERCYGAKAANVIAAIGPSIGPCCYTVGEELLPEFARHPEASNWFVRGKELRLDLWQATRDQLLRAGLAPDRIHCCGLCTFDHPKLFPSYRRDGKSAGRLVAAIRTAPGTTL
jgi:hypothetical protein